ncbi:transposase IS66 family protein [Candidatus Erwinia dacicola]|uniref:Transposase IS66 family protein n=1 Tax=Candidatus Erwinia dacicola TaxID=252393 RepID=A0A328TKV9_9GAMM|nr:transposase IS66 family protein [Candidatus Erwinia dacicola]
MWFAYSPDRKGVHPQQHYEDGRITGAACMAHTRRKIHDVHACTLTDITTEALRRIGELYAIEAV